MAQPPGATVGADDAAAAGYWTPGKALARRSTVTPGSPGAATGTHWPVVGVLALDGEVVAGHRRGGGVDVLEADQRRDDQRGAAVGDGDVVAEGVATAAPVAVDGQRRSEVGHDHRAGPCGRGGRTTAPRTVTSVPGDGDRVAEDAAVEAVACRRRC